MKADEDARVPSLRSLVYGGARMHTSVLELALQLFPETDFVNAYGLTETSSTVALLGPDDHRLAMYSDDPVFDRSACRRSASRCRASRSGSPTRPAPTSASIRPARSRSAATR